MRLSLRWACSVGVLTLATVFATTGHAEVNQVMTSGSICLGPYVDSDYCEENGAANALAAAGAACGGYGGLSSYSAQSCAYYEAPMFNLDEDAVGAVSSATCPPTGGANGIYNIVDYYCNN